MSFLEHKQNVIALISLLVVALFVGGYFLVTGPLSGQAIASIDGLQEGQAGFYVRNSSNFFGGLAATYISNTEVEIGYDLQHQRGGSLRLPISARPMQESFSGEFTIGFDPEFIQANPHGGWSDQFVDIVKYVGRSGQQITPEVVAHQTTLFFEAIFAGSTSSIIEFEGVNMTGAEAINVVAANLSENFFEDVARFVEIEEERILNGLSQELRDEGDSVWNRIEFPLERLEGAINVYFESLSEQEQDALSQRIERMLPYSVEIDNQQGILRYQYVGPVIPADYVKDISKVWLTPKQVGQTQVTLQDVKMYNNGENIIESVANNQVTVNIVERNLRDVLPEDQGIQIFVNNGVNVVNAGQSNTIQVEVTAGDDLPDNHLVIVWVDYAESKQVIFTQRHEAIGAGDSYTVSFDHEVPVGTQGNATISAFVWANYPAGDAAFTPLLPRSELELPIQ